MLDFHKNHRLLVLTAFTVFLVLSIIIAVIPAYQLQETEPLPNMEALSDQELRGLQVTLLKTVSLVIPNRSET